MTRFVIDLWMDGYETEEEHDAACIDFIKDQLDFAGSSVDVLWNVDKEQEKNNE